MTDVYLLTFAAILALSALNTVINGWRGLVQLIITMVIVMLTLNVSGVIK